VIQSVARVPTMRVPGPTLQGCRSPETDQTSGEPRRGHGLGLLERVAAHAHWPGFGRITAEADLAWLRPADVR
jgi:hypothetical protein